MNDRSDRVTGWALAVVLFIHMVLLRDSVILLLAAFVVLLVGAALRGRQSFVPPWTARILLLLGAGGIVALQTSPHPAGLLGELAGGAGALLLLRPVTPARGLRILFCVLIALAATILQSSSGVGPVFVVVDVIVLVILAEQVHRPPEAALSLWISLLRTLRVVIPVGAAVTLIFWLFPDLSLPPIQTTGRLQVVTGFSGGGVMNPGSVASLGTSRRVALVARFPKSQPIPTAQDLYWRGHVLEKNEGLRWTTDAGRQGRVQSFADAPVPMGVARWKYLEDVGPNGGILAVLDCGVSVEATQAGQDVVVLDQGASVMTTLATGMLKLEVTSARENASDPPAPEIADGCTGVPREVRAGSALRGIVEKLISPQRNTVQNLEVVAGYLSQSGFTYTMRPGRMSPGDVSGFLLKNRRGFCEHYAAATANILRIGGVPARIIVGYRGGEWNPWRRTFTIHDSDAHVWVEAWDATARRWVRFDPTAFVAPEFTARFERELDSDHWPWYRLVFSYISAVWAAVSEVLEEFSARLQASEVWESLPPVLLGGLALAATIWLFRNVRGRRNLPGSDLAESLLADLERLALRSGRGRRAGETPLAWLARIAHETGRISEVENLRHFAASYEAGVYCPDGADPATTTSLRVGARHLRAIWRNHRDTALVRVPANQKM